MTKEHEYQNVVISVAGLIVNKVIATVHERLDERTHEYAVGYIRREGRCEEVIRTIHNDKMVGIWYTIS